MYVLVSVLAVALSTVAYVALRNRVMFNIGVRNIPRRRAQTVLIVLGLMLSTLIISAAFATGDTVDRSITSEIYSILGSLDETVQVRATSDDEVLGEGDDGLAAREVEFAASDAAPLVEAIGKNPLVDAVVPLYINIAAATNLEKRQSAPSFTVVGLDPEGSRDLPDIETLGGSRLRVADLRPNEIYIDETAADELQTRVGESITLSVYGQPRQFLVKAIVQDRRLAGAGGVSGRRAGGVLPLAEAQRLFGAEGQLTHIGISNKGGARDGVRHSVDVTRETRATIRSLRLPARLDVTEVKRIGVEIAETGASIFTTFFLVLGLFSIAAGVLLIFMIFVMLAAERKSEMGMSRAVGTKRLDLVQSFLAEGMGYNLVAAAVGTALGVGVAFVMVKIMARIFAEVDISLSPHVTVRSLIISYSLGVAITFLTVTVSSWRVSNINIVRAIRDIPDPPQPKPLWQAHGIIPTVRGLLIRSSNLRGWGVRAALLVVGVLAMMSGFGSGVVALQVLFSLLAFVLLLAFIFLTFKLGPLFIVAGVPLTLLGASADVMAALYLGLSLIPMGLALTIRSFGVNERLTYTSAGLILLYIWEFDFQLRLIERVFGQMEGDVEMFFLSGVVITVAATFVLVYNSDLALGLLSRLGRWLGAFLPSLKMAIAYPLSNKVRTGLTMAMFCLVVFALTMMSSMNHNFSKVFLSDRALGGFDIGVDENPTNPITDLRQALVDAGSPAASELTTVGVSAQVSRFRSLVCQPDRAGECQPDDRRDFDSYSMRGDDAGFLNAVSLSLQSRSSEFASDDEAWAAIGRDPGLAIIDAFALPGGGFGGGGGFLLHGVSAGDEVLPSDLNLVILDRTSGRTKAVRVIGIIELGSSGAFNGIHVSSTALEDVFGKPDIRRFFVTTSSGDKRATAREIESALLTSGAQAESLRHELEVMSGTFNSFFYLMQGFMGLGLFVGVAAVGVIAFRTVVERRQQIGMLRALGYTRGMIGLTFLIESAFIALLGVSSGIFFALILARQLITDEFANQGVTTFIVPWTQVGVIGALAFGFALLMTIVPSRQAAGIPIAQALRYE